MRALICHPGASWATHDVYAGAVEGLKAAGVHLAEWRLDGRIERWHDFLHFLWRRQRKATPATAWPKPTPADTLHAATTGLIERALERGCTDLIVVSAMFLPPNKIELARRAGLRVWLLCTESPYDMADELRVAGLVNGVWTHERAALAAFREVNPCTAYLPHAWRPGVHDRPASASPDVPAADVLFVGSYFPERIAWFESVDWSGINVALYGTTELIPKRSPLRQFVRGGLVPNAQLPALAQASQITINFFRAPAPGRVAESLNPRLYEMAAAGVCSVTDWRPEVPEIFGDAVPTFQAPAEAGAVIRALLADPVRRRACGLQAQAAVSGATWIARGQQMVTDIQRWTTAHKE